MNSKRLRLKVARNARAFSAVAVVALLTATTTAAQSAAGSLEIDPARSLWQGAGSGVVVYALIRGVLADIRVRLARLEAAFLPAPGTIRGEE